MATQRRQVREGRLERQRSGLCETRRAQLETASTRGRIKARLFLREDVWNEEKINQRQNGKRSEFED
jgi:hypothetical protein